MRPNPGDPQFPQCPSNLCRRHLHWVLLHSGLIALMLFRCLKQARLVRIERHRPTELLHITPQQLHVLFGRIMPHEARQQPARRIVYHCDQVKFLAAPFQPVVLTGVPLHQLPKTAAAWSPSMHLLHLLRLGAPQLASHHPLPHRLLTRLNPMFGPQVLRRQGRSKASIDIRRQQLHRFLLGRLGDPPLRWFSTQSVDHHLVATSLQRQQQPLHVTSGHPQLLTGFALRDQLLLCLFQCHQPVSIGLRHQ